MKSDNKPLVYFRPDPVARMAAYDEAIESLILTLPARCQQDGELRNAIGDALYRNPGLLIRAGKAAEMFVSIGKLGEAAND